MILLISFSFHKVILSSQVGGAAITVSQPAADSGQASKIAAAALRRYFASDDTFVLRTYLVLFCRSNVAPIEDQRQDQVYSASVQSAEKYRLYTSFMMQSVFAKCFFVAELRATLEAGNQRRDREG